MSATPKTNFLRDACVKKFIEVPQIGGIISQSGTTITNAICASFDQQEGRYITTFVGQTVNLHSWLGRESEYGESVQQLDQPSSTLILDCLQPDTYYGTYYDDSGYYCRLTYKFTIKEEQIYSVPNIEEIYCAEWDDSWIGTTGQQQMILIIMQQQVIH